MNKIIYAEYITRIEKGDIPGSWQETKKEDIIRGTNCQYLMVPRSETEPIWCRYHHQEVTPNCFCCWAKRLNYPKEHTRGV